ncbi:MAG: VRR-NUC domain-containing protein [Oscillospiraceae bacterium]|jgi:hypothetical protein|nr:VRR-NUC domain-containing protein [Oscillospiraceae bacterium]
MNEYAIERRLAQGVRAAGGLCLKFTSPGTPGVPDRIVITADGRVIFIELKTEIGRLASIQRWMIEELQKRGADVRVLKGKQAVDDFLKEVMPHEV